MADLPQLAGVLADVAREAVRARLLRPAAGPGGGVGREHERAWPEGYAPAGGEGVQE